jgi:molybdate transport system substrate-binding protein
MKRNLILLICLLLIIFTAPVFAEEIQVYAASSLTDAMNDIGKQYEKETGNHLVFNYAASSLLARQIQEGAPADIFFSADEARMDSLQKSKLIIPETRKSLLSNTLVIVVPEDSSMVFASAQDLTKIRGYIAIGEPQSVPVGIYAKEYLKKINIWSKIIDRVVPRKTCGQRWQRWNPETQMRVLSTKRMQRFLKELRSRTRYRWQKAQRSAIPWQLFPSQKM